MTATAHALVGGIIVSSVQNPALGIALSALSHPVMDAIPHWDFGTSWKKKSRVELFFEASLDLLIGVVSSYFLFGQRANPWYFWTAIFAVEVWDLLIVPYWLFKWRFPPFSTFYDFTESFHGKMKPLPGIITQIVTVLGTILLFQYMLRI